jgi:hypothetical protein
MSFLLLVRNVSVSKFRGFASTEVLSCFVLAKAW